MLKKITYKELEECLKSMEEFVCASVKANKCEGKKYYGEYPVLYEVFSYDTRIAFVMSVGHKGTLWVLNEHKYSPTTSKIQGIIRGLWGEYLSCNEEMFTRRTNLIWDD